MGAYNAYQQSDAHSYWEFNYQGTNWIHHGFPNNERLFLPATAFNRFAVTREINDGLLAPRFAPSQRAWVLTGFRVAVTPSVPAFAGRDSDAR